jgi:hypothetical protein
MAAMKTKIKNTAPKIFWLALALFALAFAAQQLLVPNVQPVAWAQEPQALWAVETAFVLRALQYVGALVAGLALLMIAAAWLAGRRR